MVSQGSRETDCEAYVLRTGACSLLPLEACGLLIPFFFLESGIISPLALESRKFCWKVL